MEEMVKEKTEITMVSTLPPIKGLSPYTKGLVQGLIENDVEVH